MKNKLTEQEIKQSVEILTKFSNFVKDGKLEAAKKYLLKTKHELCNTNR